MLRIATIVILAACGTLTTVSAPRVGANFPTPWVGIWERINIGVFLLWVPVLAVTTLSAGLSMSPGRQGTRSA